jgi:hypothetical protein
VRFDDVHLAAGAGDCLLTACIDGEQTGAIGTSPGRFIEFYRTRGVDDDLTGVVMAGRAAMIFGGLIAVGVVAAPSAGRPALATSPRSGASTSVAASMCFTTKQNIRLPITGAGAESIRQGDLNGDGRRDLVVSGAGTGGKFSGGFSVLLHGVHGFARPVRYLVGLDIWDVNLADMNQDGYLDVTATNYSDGAVVVLYGDGTGNLQDQAVVPVGTAPSRVVTRDFNADTYPDLAVLRNEQSLVSIVLNEDGGGFAEPVDYSTGPWPGADFSSRDVDQDGHLDILLAEYGPAYQNGWLTILFGKDGGRFDQPEVIPAGVNPVAVDSGDFNEDGLPDVVIGLNNGPQGIQILLNQGNRIFVDSGTYPFGINPRDPEVADLNGDGHLDVAVAAVLGAPYGAPRDVAVFTGRGDGTFDGQPAVFGPQKGGAGVVALYKHRGETPNLAIENLKYARDFLAPSVSVLANCSQP